MDSNKKLFTRKEASLERKLSKFLVDLRWGALHKNTPNAKTKLISKKLRKTNPKVEEHKKDQEIIQGVSANEEQVV